MKTTSTKNVGRLFATTLFAGLFGLIGFAQTNFSFTGGEQTWVVPTTGTYLIEAWGAEGGAAYCFSVAGDINPGKGGYTSRYVNLTAGQILYINVGGQGAYHGNGSSGNISGGYNGGGNSASTVAWGGGGGGGGASHVAVSSGVLSSLVGNQADVLVVAGGGGGAWACTQFGWTNFRDGSDGGAGGGLTGQGAGYGYTMGYTIGGGCNNINNQCDIRCQAYWFTTGGSQFAGGSLGNINAPCSFASATPSGFGLGGTSLNAASHSGGGGGGGWYGGGGGASGENANGTGGGGGSSYNNLDPSGSNIAGNAVMPNPIGGTMMGRSGNGFVRISALCTPTAFTLIDPTPNATGQCSVTPATPTATDDCGTTVNGVPDVAFPITTPGTTVVTWTFTSGAVSTTQTQNVIVSAPALQTIVPVDQEICPNTSADIELLGSEAGIQYFLRNDTNDSIVDGPVAGTGAGLTFNTGNLAATTDFNIMASSPSGALTFPGSAVAPGHYVDLTNNALFNITGDITLETWVKVDAHQPDWVRLIGKGDFVNRTYGLWLNGGTGDLLWQMYGATDLNLAGPALTPGVWYHLAAVRNGNNCEIYVDGVLAASTTYTGTPFLSAAPATLGSNLINHDSYDGTMDEVRIWNVARTGAEIALNRYNCLTGTEPGLVAYYQMEDGSGSVVTDQTPNGLNGNFVGAAWNPSTAWVNGVATCSDCQIEMPAIITVTVDETDPIAVCQDLDVYLNAGGLASITAADIDGGSTDFCPVTLSASQTTFNCDDIPVSPLAVTLTVTDDNGNSDQCIAQITVIDTVPPTASCQNFTIALDAAGNATVQVSDINNGSTDACSVASITLSQTDFDCSHLGDNTVTLTVTDNSGNVATCNATVTIQDLEAPVISCPAAISVDTDPGICGATVNYTIPTATDNCDGSGGNILFVSDVASGTEIATTLANEGYIVTTILNDFSGGDNPTLQGALSAYDAVYWHAIGNGSGDTHNASTFTNLNAYVAGGGNVFVTGYDVIASPADPNLWTFLGGSGSVDVPPGGGQGTILGPPNSLNDGFANIIGLVLSNPGDHDALTGILPGVTTVATNGSGVEWSIYNTGGGDIAWVSSGQHTAPFPAWTTPGTGYYEAVLNFAFNSATSGGGVLTVTQTDATGLTSGDVFPIGTTTLEYTVTDQAGNSDVCQFDVTVTDNEDPTALCQNIDVYLNGAGTATITPADIDNGSSDNCAIATLSLDITSFNCTDIGGNPVVLTVEDIYGNTSSCPATVTVFDTVPPTAICQDITLPLNGGGTLTIGPADVNFGSNDACGIASYSLDITNFNCSNVGPNTVTMTVTDNHGNSSTCTSIVTVQDVTAPTVACQDITVQLDASGNATITPAQIDNGSSDVCGIASLSLDVTSFNCADLGPNAVNLLVTDVNGNSNSCPATVTVFDTLAPIVNCPSDITLDAVLNNCGRIVTYPLTASDNCSYTITQTDGTGYTSGDLFPVGTTVQTYEIEDQSGNVTICSFDVTIEDNQLPSITGCPSDITVNTQAGVCQAVASWIQPTASDNCPGVIFGTSHAPGSVFPLDSTLVTYTATDASGNVSTCTFYVIVVDNQAPIFVDCPADITISNDPGLCEAATLLGSPTVTDNCSVASVTPSFTGPFPVGTTVVTWTALDGSGNSSTCIQNVIVTDDEAPIALCNDTTIYLNAAGSVSIVAADIDGGSNDNCALSTLSASQTAFSCSNVGNNTVTLTVTDIYGNSSSCPAVVTVIDTVAPIATCVNYTAQLDATGNATITASNVDGGSNDACGIASTSVSPSAFTCANIGANSVVLTVTDNNGNVSTCTATVTVEDNVDPNAVCQDTTIYLNAAGLASIVAADIDGGSNDACGISSLTADITNFSCADLGTNTVMLTVEDLYGNTSSCPATVTVLDTVAPIANCQDIAIQLDAAGQATITGLDINNGSTDACGGLTYAVTPNTFTCAEVGSNTVTLTVTDGSGNSSTCTATVTVSDTIDPVVVCNDITIQLDAAGNATLVADDILNSSVGGYIVDQSGTFAPIASPIAGTQVSLSDDVVSGVLPIGFNFTFFDNTYSDFYISSNGYITFSAAQPNGCCTGQLLPDPNPANNLIAFHWEDIDPGNGGQPVENLVQYTTIGAAPNRVLVVEFYNTDHFPNGNNVTSQLMLYETSNIIEMHTTAMPTDGGLHTQGIENIDGTIAYTTPGRNQTSWSAFNDYVAFIPVPASGASDACGIDTTFVDISTFNCSNVGPNTVTVTAVDVNGNSATCTATVTVEDNIAPVALCHDTTIYVDALGSASILAGDIDNGSNDACGILSLSVSPNAFDCSNLGANTVTLTVLDVNGNSSTCSATVTVLDTIAPTIACPADIAVNNDLGDCGAVVSFPSPIIDDNCSTSGGPVAFVQNTDFTFTDGLSCGFGGITSTARVYDLVAEGVSGDLEVTSVEFAVLAVNSAIADQIQLNLYVVPSFPIPTASLPAPLYSETVSVPAAAAGTVYTHTLATPPTIPAGSILLYELTVDSNNGAYPWLVGHNVAPTPPSTETPASYIKGSCGVPDYVAVAAVGFPNNAPIMTLNGTQGLVAVQTAGLPSGSTFPVGTTTNTFVVTDGSGNTATCSFDVTVTDNEAPITVCNNIDVYLNGAGNATITVGDIDGGSTDNCAIATTSIDVNTFDCSDLGANPVVLTVEDIYGNTSSCTAIVTVLDTIAPVLTCPADITVSADPGVCDASFVAYGMATAVDNCSATVTIVNDAPAVFPLGTTIVTWTATDGFGNIGTCEQLVTVIDSENPVIVCPGPVVVSTDPGSCEALASGVTLGTATATDNCAVASITNDAPATFPLGTTNVTWTATDFEGNFITCIQVVTVEDNEAPVVTCPAPVTVSTDGGSCFATGVALGLPAITENCTVASVTNNAPLVYPLGTTTVTWTVTDLAGNATTCDQIVTVEDTQAPIIFCPSNVNVAADPGLCTASMVSLGSPLTFDNCTVDAVTNDAPAAFPIGATTVTWTVTDLAGNSASCTQIVTVIDTQNPTIACAGPVTVSADLGSCMATGVVLTAPTVGDNCGTTTVTNNAPLAFPLGTTIVTWTVTDDAGLTATCTQSVTVQDNEAPSIICPADVIVATAGGSCDVSFVNLGTPVTDDNCSVVSVFNSGPVTYPLGATTVTWFVMDAAGTMTTCTQTVTVVDTEAPQINCPSDVVVSTDAGSCDATAVVIGMATATDNCTVASITNDAPLTYPLGTTTITWTATDAAGNSTTCTQIVTVTDNELPTITCPGDLNLTTDAGSCEATGVVLGTPVTDDNCSVASVTNNAPSIFPLGTTNVTWTVIDGSGNVRTCVQTITVTDNELPTIACAANVTIGTIPGLCEGTTTLVAPAVADNCSIASVTNDAPAFYPLGTTIVTWTVEDGSGNTATCQQLVTVEDTEDPTIFCPANIATSTDPGMCYATVALGTPVVDDNCNIASVTNNAPATFPLGTTVVTWTIVDDYGNSATCTQTITVTDDEAPLVVCPADITVSNVPGNCGRSVSYAIPTFMDNCNVTAMTQTDGTGLTSGSWFPMGTTIQEYTVVDEAGNTYSCSFTVTVEDNEAPMISNCPSDITVYSTAEKCEMTVNFGTPVISDNCSGVTYTASHFSGEAFPVGVTTVVYSATDGSGNTATCSFDVEVIDTIAPVAPTLASVQGGCEVTLDAPTATDNCSGEIVGTTTTVFPVTATGITAVTWTFTDANGNSSTSVQYISIDGVVDATVSYVNDITLQSNNTTPGATYQWIDCGTGLPLAGENDQTFVAAINGSYAVQVTEPGCPPVTSICYTINSVGIEDVTVEDLVVYPNPSIDGIFNIKYEGTIEKVEVIDMLGRYITVPTDVTNHVVNASELATGKYMLRIYTDAGITAKEVIIINK